MVRAVRAVAYVWNGSRRCRGKAPAARHWRTHSQSSTCGRSVTGIDKATTAGTLNYDPWGGACSDVRGRVRMPQRLQPRALRPRPQVCGRSVRAKGCSRDHSGCCRMCEMMRSTFRTTQLSTLPSRARQAGRASTVQRGPVLPYSQRLHALVIPAPLTQAHAEPFVMPGLVTLSAIVRSPVRTREALGTPSARREECRLEDTRR